jgi:hypothetical protein
MIDFEKLKAWLDSEEVEYDEDYYFTVIKLKR